MKWNSLVLTLALAGLMNATLAAQESTTSVQIETKLYTVTNKAFALLNLPEKLAEKKVLPMDGKVRDEFEKAVLKNRSECDIVSSPRISTFDMQTASISMGQLKPNLSKLTILNKNGDMQTKPEYENVQVGFEMKLTPKVASDKKRFSLDVHAEMTNLEGASSSVTPLDLTYAFKPANVPVNGLGNAASLFSQLLARAETNRIAVDCMAELKAGTSVLV